MRRTGTLQGRRGHAAFALALAACAVLLAFWAKAPAFGEEGGATGQTEVETVDVQFSNIFRPDGDYEAHRNLTGEQYAVGDVGGQIHASNNPNSTALSLPLEVGYTVGGAATKTRGIGSSSTRHLMEGTQHIRDIA